jgi:hypothetical protein
LERTSWNVCFGSSFWRELHGMFCSLKHAWLLDVFKLLLLFVGSNLP